jgi:poly-gamma-glutamate capsule biosynthesis protein CapA/YwtB (metallophosphatase superfamily)
VIAAMPPVESPPPRGVHTSASIRHCVCTTIAALVVLLSGCAPLPTTGTAATAETHSGPLVTLVFAGDVVLDDTAGALIARGSDPFAEFADVFAAADLRAANLECVVATTGHAHEKNYTFCAHPRVLPTLTRHLDALALANNHSGDFGREAFAEMLALLTQAGLGYFGGGHDLSEAHRPLILTRRELRVALLGCNEFMPRRFEADADAPGVAWSDDGRCAPTSALHASATARTS